MAYNRRKKRVKNTVTEAEAHIHATYNNTIVTISDKNGDISGDTNYAIERDGEKLKLKAALNYNLIGTVLTVQVVGSDGSSAEIQMEVV